VRNRFLHNHAHVKKARDPSRASHAADGAAWQARAAIVARA
jgi:hypothetical protein